MSSHDDKYGTPRTDSASWGKRISPDCIRDEEVVSAEFARRLERELAEARDRLANAELDRDAHKDRVYALSANAASEVPLCECVEPVCIRAKGGIMRCRKTIQSSSGASEDAKDVTIRHWVQRALAAEGAIADHNNGLLEACGKTSNHPHVKESRRCDSRRDCPDCPRDWHVAVDQSALPSAIERTKLTEHATAGLTAQMVRDHYPETQHQPDECQLCCAVYEIAAEALDNTVDRKANDGTR
jgi:hypothetical protein